jgi:hypothetical protein
MASERHTAEKNCCICGADVSQTKRFKDPSGNYFCGDCYAEATTKDAVGNAELATCASCGSKAPAEHLQRQGDKLLCEKCINLPKVTAPSPQADVSHLYGIRPRINCPHCWHQFHPEQILWVSQHAELTGDPVLGPEAPARFLPTRFTVTGQAIDARGMACQQLACPRCHLILPRALIETEPLIVSIVGVPASGKSYFLTCLTWELRRLLPSRFHITFTDVDTVSNRHLNEYEETLFLQADPNQLVALRKTELQGDLYESIRLGQQVISLPRPFLFSVKAGEWHPASRSGRNFDRIVCLYDNAGEHFQPGMDSVSSPVTQHLAKSRVLMFLYDPTQDPRFRERCRSVSNDPQFHAAGRSQRQETILTEAAARIRRYAGLGSNKKYDRPLMIVVPKMDAWQSLLDEPVPPEPLAPNKDGWVVDVELVEKVSQKLRQLLQRLTPEFVAAAENFAEHVVYIPVSALGRAPE